MLHSLWNYSFQEYQTLQNIVDSAAIARFSWSLCNNLSVWSRFCHPLVLKRTSLGLVPGLAALWVLCSVLTVQVKVLKLYADSVWLFLRLVDGNRTLLVTSGAPRAFFRNLFHHNYDERKGTKRNFTFSITLLVPVSHDKYQKFWYKTK